MRQNCSFYSTSKIYLLQSFKLFKLTNTIFIHFRAQKFRSCIEKTLSGKFFVLNIFQMDQLFSTWYKKFGVFFQYRRADMILKMIDTIAQKLFKENIFLKILFLHTRRHKDYHSKNNQDSFLAPQKDRILLKTELLKISVKTNPIYVWIHLYVNTKMHEKLRYQNHFFFFSGA